LKTPRTVEALKFTARRLAEMTTAVVAENWQPAVLNNLANDLWQKAEYVARETERRRLQEIFVENFCERFRELKPEVSAAAIPNFDTQPEVSPAKDIDSVEQSSVTVENVSTPDAAATNTTEVEGKKDEFLGFVKSGEPFVETSVAETDAATITAMRSAPENTEQETVKTAPGDEPVAGEKVSTENPNETKPQSTAVAAPVADAKDSLPAAASAIKNNATAPKPTDAKEPFEFGKCTVNLNLTLLPASGDGRGGRRAIVSAASHNLPPEIEFLEISEGENLTKIADLMRGKLERFRQTLPAKYIEQLRASKSKTAKKPATVKHRRPLPLQLNRKPFRRTAQKQTAGNKRRIRARPKPKQLKPKLRRREKTRRHSPRPSRLFHNRRSRRRTMCSRTCSKKQKNYERKFKFRKRKQRNRNAGGND
jgi:hypothetical protein